MMWYAAVAGQTAVSVAIMSAGLFILSGIMLVPIVMYAVYPSLETGLLSVHNLATSAMLSAFGGAIFIVGAGVLKLVSVSVKRRYTE